jgi:hypothetical protein
LATLASNVFDTRSVSHSGEDVPYTVSVVYILLSALEQFSIVQVLESLSALQAGLLFVPRALLLAFQAKGAHGSLELGLAYALGSAYIAYKVCDLPPWDDSTLAQYVWRQQSSDISSSKSETVQQQDDKSISTCAPHAEASEPSRWSLRLLALVSFVPLFLYISRSAFPSTTIPSVDSDAASLHSSFPYLRGEGSDASLDIIISHYDEPVEGILEMLQPVRELPIVQRRHVRTILYHKGEDRELGERVAAAIQADQTVFLPNVGREGGTYLQHILRTYNESFPSTNPDHEGDGGGVLVHRRGRLWKQVASPSSSSSSSLSYPPAHDGAVPASTSTGSSSSSSSSSTTSSRDTWRPLGFADHTMFLQSHLAWHWIAQPRMTIFEDRSGYISLAPYVRLDCGRDMQGNGDFIRLREIHVLFREEVRSLSSHLWLSIKTDPRDTFHCERRPSFVHRRNSWALMPLNLLSRGNGSSLILITNMRTSTP